MPKRGKGVRKALNPLAAAEARARPFPPARGGQRSRVPPNTDDSWSWSKSSRACVTLNGLTNGQHLDLMSVRTDTGTTPECGGSSMGGPSREYFFSAPVEAKTADFTFVVQRSRGWSSW